MQFFKYFAIVGISILTLSVKAQDTIAVSPVSFNSNDREFAPMYIQNGLVFCGINDNNQALTYLDASTGKPMTDMFYISTSDSSFGEKSLFSTSLQTSFHDGPITFSADEKTAYFTRSRLIEKKLRNTIKKVNNLGVYKATFNGTEWVNITPCSFNSEEYNVGQPTLSKDGKRLYVVSDKKGGFGGKDLYFVDINGDSLGELINMGKNVNSAANEMFPFITSSNTLYFSSDKTGGFGGLDVYTYDRANKTVRLITDTAINTSFDDFSIIFNEQENEGYLTSNRLGSDDIFKINITYPEFENCEEIKKEQLCYEFFEEATLNADSVAMLYQWDFGDGTKEEKLEVYHCYEKPGFYVVNLNIMDPIIDKVFVNQDTYELEIDEVLQPLIEFPDSININQDFVVIVEQGKWMDYNIDNIYINYGDSTIIKNSKKPHQYLKEGIYEIKIMITGTDSSTGEIKINCFYKSIHVKDTLNTTASQQIKLELLELDGFSLTHKEETDDTVDLDSYYSLELLQSDVSIKNDSIKLKTFVNAAREMFDDVTQSYSYLVGKTSYPFDLLDKYRYAHHLGFDSAQVKAYNHTEKSIIIDDLGLVEIDSVGATNITLKNIYFNYEAFELSDSSEIELNKLVVYLNGNEKSIEIGAHTDSKGDDLYNKSLSEKRAESVMNFLIKKGIHKNRLKSKGYGESMPIAPNQYPNGDDNPLGRAKNRRVTIKIL